MGWTNSEDPLRAVGRGMAVGVLFGALNKQGSTTQGKTPLQLIESTSLNLTISQS